MSVESGKKISSQLSDHDFPTGVAPRIPRAHQPLRFP
jgi:hypothetical protein